MQREAGVLLDSMGIYGIDPVEPASSLSEADGHKIELLKLLAAGARVIVIDNITGNYNDRELDGLIRIMLKLREKGIAVLFMTNKYNSMFRCANGAAVMRNGTVVFVDRGGKYTRDKIISIASAGEIYSPEIKKRGDTSRIVLEAAGVRSLKQPASQKSSFKLYKNEILGVCDDENENAADIVNSLLGNEKYTGSFFVDNREVKIRNFKTAVKNGIGVVSGDMINGVFYNMSIYDNITLMMPKKMYGVFGTINMRIKKFCLSQTVEKLDCRDLLESYGPANTIEGAGKVDRVRIATAKWVCAGMKIIVFINPYYSFDDLNIMMFEHLLERLRTIGISVLILSKRDAAMYRMCDRVLRVEDGVLNNI